MKEESFTSTLANHISKIEFQLSEYRFPDQPVKSIMKSWPAVSEKMMGSEDFGLAFTAINNWLSDDLKLLVKDAADQEEKTRKIFEYVRDHFTCTSTYGTRLGDNTSLKDVFKRKSGSVSEINLLLLAMLRHEEIPSEPVLMSLRSRGLVDAIYPLMDRFNYLVCQVKIGGQLFYLDASKPMIGFNKLPESCYNGIAWVLSKEEPAPVFFYADSLREEKRSSVFIINNDKNKYVGAFNSQLGYYESADFREKMSKTKKEDYLKEIARGYSSDVKVANLEIDSLSKYEEPVSIRYEFDINNEEDVLYFNPMFSEGMKQNPFKSAQRNYPVEMPYTVNEVFILNMEVPAGYAIEEIPKSVRFKMNDGEGMFEYLCVKSPDKIQLQSTIKINKANFGQEDYESLREFYSFIIKKQSEQIVFKKIK